MKVTFITQWANLHSEISKARLQSDCTLYKTNKQFQPHRLGFSFCFCLALTLFTHKTAFIYHSLWPILNMASFCFPWRLFKSSISLVLYVNYTGILKPVLEFDGINDW